MDPQWLSYGGNLYRHGTMSKSEKCHAKILAFRITAIYNSGALKNHRTKKKMNFWTKKCRQQKNEFLFPSRPLVTMWWKILYPFHFSEITEPAIHRTHTITTIPSSFTNIVLLVTTLANLLHSQINRRRCESSSICLQQSHRHRCVWIW